MTDVTKQQNKAIKPAKKKEKQRSVIYTVALPIVRFLFKTILPVRYHGLENVRQMDAPYILMGNHVTMIDPVIMAAAAPKYQIRFIGKKELTKNKLLNAFFNELRMIPVDRHNTDMEAMRACMRVTREGGVLGIFPEGTRHHKGLMEEIESGVALIALRSKVPLVPIYLAGKLRFFRSLDVYVGEPISMDDLREMGVNTESCRLLMGRITTTYAALEAARTNP